MDLDFARYGPSMVSLERYLPFFLVPGLVLFIWSLMPV